MRSTRARSNGSWAFGPPRLSRAAFARHSTGTSPTRVGGGGSWTGAIDRGPRSITAYPSDRAHYDVGRPPLPCPRADVSRDSMLSAAAWSVVQQVGRVLLASLFYFVIAGLLSPTEMGVLGIATVW